MTEEQQKIIDDYKAHRMERVSALSHNELMGKSSAAISTKHIALTFDCCFTCRRLSALKKMFFLKSRGIPATFFVTGVFIRNRGLIVRIINKLSFEIMNHSLSHRSFLDLSKEEQQHEIADNADTIRSITGLYPDLFRFPFGDCGINSLRLTESMGVKAIRWDVDTSDWKKGRTGEETYKAIMNKIKPGSIILCHISGNGFAGIKKAVNELKEDGYTFVTVHRLLELEEEEKSPG